MENTPTVSVVIPCFNDGHYLPQALQSVHAQTLQPLEILIINDGSTDLRTIELLEGLDLLAATVIHQENRGLSAARNTGIRNAKGKYVYFIDADDVIDPACLATLAQMLETGNAVAATSAIRICGGPDRGNKWGRSYNPYLVLVRNQWSAGLMLRREASRKLGLHYDESMRSGYEDWEFNIRLGRANHEILFVTEPLYEYRIRNKSLLSTTRIFHVEVVNYIRAKHRDLYTVEALMNTKRAYAPALRVFYEHNYSDDLEDWLKNQTFQDWCIGPARPNGEEEQYCFFFPNVDALRRLPPETLECALMALECYRQADRCLLAVRHGCTSLFSMPSPTLELDDRRYPIALITRNHGEADNIAPEEALRQSDLVLEFIDQDHLLPNAWDANRVQIPSNALTTGSNGLPSVRQKLRSFGKQIFGHSFERECIRVYDHLYYRVLRSEAAFTARNQIRSVLGNRLEEMISRVVYGAFLTEAPREEGSDGANSERAQANKLSPLFLRPTDNRIHILIATNWLIEGGVEQIIFEICRLLDPAQFRLTIVTTLPSHHSWDRLAREAGASVYHLADFLKPAEMIKGLLHFVFNQHVDCMFIMNSEAAYRAARTLKRRSPWLPIVDRIEAPDPGGGYPMISAKVGREFIDLRTVSHKKLADYMCRKYRLGRSVPRAIYIGMNTNRLREILNLTSTPLREACGVSPETPIVLFLGRFVDQKRPEIFVQTVAKIRELQPECDAHFAMIGDGHRLSGAKALISGHGLGDRIHLLGAEPNGAALLAEATLLMMPSAYEGVALVSYEAMALGIPQIFANVGGQSELITPETGILIDNGPGEITRYAQACLELLSDPARRARMVAAGKERIRSQFTAEMAVKQYAEIFEQYARLSRRRASEIPHLEPPHIDPLRDAL